MKRIPRISESEWQVMKLLWAKSPQTANEIVEALAARTSWKNRTIRTLINRLVEKKAVGYAKKGREYHYYALIGEAECIRAESHSFLRRVYSGAMKPILSAFMEDEDLSPEDIEDLKRILDKKERK
ncbi:MAG: BlaI/MecI/CopY family transcriptional regulator [Planctomycetota bacterium]|jgi:BlaI family penicillinase repressor